MVKKYVAGLTVFRAQDARKREPSSKQARFIRHWRRFACFPFLGYLRAKSRLAAVALRNAPAGAVPRTPPSPARGMQHP